MNARGLIGREKSVIAYDCTKAMERGFSELKQTIVKLITENQKLRANEPPENPLKRTKTTDVGIL